MKFVNFRAGEQIRLGIKVEQGIIDIQQAAASCGLKVPETIEQVLAAGEIGREQLVDLLKRDVQVIAEDKLVYAPCIINPEKIICIGMNYVSHREEFPIDSPEMPVVFSKFNNALAAHNQTIILPKSATKIDYEAELVIVIGKKAVDVSVEEAASYVFGYTVGNDLSARDLQFRTGQWLLGKTCDQFAPVGPCIVTADEVDPNDLDISCMVNGVVRQSANTRDMIFNCATIISYLSKHLTLKPGDMIFTGTPGGVILGLPESQQQWLKSGDTVSISIEKIGTLVNRLV